MTIVCVYITSNNDPLTNERTKKAPAKYASDGLTIDTIILTCA